MADDEIAMCEVTLTSPSLDGPFIVECIASSEARAKTRVRVAAMHAFRSYELLHADCEVRQVPRTNNQGEENNHGTDHQ